MVGFFEMALANMAILAFVILGIGLILVYNSLISKRNAVKNSFSSIDVQLKKRYDLIPNLVETVKGYMKHEKSLLEEITKLRSQAIAQNTRGEAMQTDAMIAPLLGKLMAVVENYPELKANENAMHLQHTLAEVEEQISAARRFYNSSVNDYNSSIQMFPGNIVAGAFGFKQEEFFQIGTEDRGNPKVAI